MRIIIRIIITRRRNKILRKIKNTNKEKNKTNLILDGSMCAGFEEGGKDACNADSGGPLMVEEDGRHVVVGVVNGGIGCDRPKLPGLYTRVNNYIDWISETINTNTIP